MYKKINQLFYLPALFFQGYVEVVISFPGYTLCQLSHYYCFLTILQFLGTFLIYISVIYPTFTLPLRVWRIQSCWKLSSGYCFLIYILYHLFNHTYDISL